jgi:hypothetical protein
MTAQPSLSRPPAVKNFKRSLELNPKNGNATEHLKKLEGQKEAKPSPSASLPTAVNPALYDQRTNTSDFASFLRIPASRGEIRDFRAFPGAADRPGAYNNSTLKHPCQPANPNRGVAALQMWCRGWPCESNACTI